MSPNPLLVKPLPLDAFMAVLRFADGKERAIRLEPELPVVERLTVQKEDEVPASINPIAFLGACALAAIGILFAFAAYVALVIRGEEGCNCPNYVLRRQSGRGSVRRIYHVSNCPNKERNA